MPTQRHRPESERRPPPDDPTCAGAAAMRGQAPSRSSQPSRPRRLRGSRRRVQVAHLQAYPSGRPDAVEFIDMYKSFGRNKILRGTEHGPAGGDGVDDPRPLGTGKSVCIKHMVGLLYPDAGDVLVHGESVPNMPDDDLFEMRKKFGLLFQDGALFGSMNIFDNVAFPLRQHTEKGEDEIADIVSRRLNEVGLGVRGTSSPTSSQGDAQARWLRAGARARARHRAVRRAGLGT